MTVRRFVTVPSLRAALLGGAIIFAAGLTACSMDTPTDMPQYKKVRLESGPAEQSIPVAALDESALRTLADEYNGRGDGPLELTVTYDPRSRTNTAMNATEQAARIARGLRYNGVGQITTSILPVNAQGDDSRALVRYQAVTAHAPEGCQHMGGLGGHDVGPDENYEYGCSTQMLIARQISRPQDLAGNGGTVAADGRRQATMMEPYRRGEPLPDLEAAYTVD